LKTKLHEIVSKKNITWHYGDLPAFYNQTDLDRYYDHGAGNNTILLDIYSEIPGGPDVYEYTAANIIGSASAEGQGWNREHMMPQSTYNSNYPMYSDLFYVIPTDARINQLRSNYPYGVAGSPNYYTFTNSSKISKNGTANSGYTGRVYEPINEFKGDIARSLLYFAVRYEGKLSSFNFYNGSSAANDTSPLDGTEEKAFENWYVQMLLQWHAQDPVSQREIDRNNAVFAIQKNRNPFIDHPEWVNMIWVQTPDAAAPTAVQNLSASVASAYFVNLNWSASASTDVLGYRVYQNGVLVVVTKDTSISVDHLQPGTLYNFTVRAYDNGYLESTDSNLITATTLASDVYAKDLQITKYLEGTGQNAALEITNRTGHPIDLNKYRLSIQFYNSTNDNYYFPAPYELEGIVQHNENFVVLNPYSNFSCITNDEARLVSASPQMAFSGSQYLELRYLNSTVDAIGVRATDNYSVLANKSLYRLSAVTDPNTTFTLSEWQTYPSDYCQNLGNLATGPAAAAPQNIFRIFPNPVTGDTLYVEGSALEKVGSLSIFDASGRSVQVVSQPFKNTKSIDISGLATGVYTIMLDQQTLKFIKK
jgi:endonuclease I